VRLYDVLERPTPIVSLNRAVAIAMVDSPQAIRLWINLPPTAITCSTPPVPICCGGRSSEAAAQSYRRALELVTVNAWNVVCAKFSPDVQHCRIRVTIIDMDYVQWLSRLPHRKC